MLTSRPTAASLLRLAAALALSGIASPVQAGGPTPPRGFYLPYGLSASYLRREHAGEPRHSGKLGAELSLAYTRDALWYGAYADASYDLAANSGWLSLGPEFGSVLLGVDAGIVCVTRLGETQLGYRARLVGNLPYWGNYSPLQLFAGGGALLDDGHQPFLDVGILIKFGNRLSP